MKSPLPVEISRRAAQEIRELEIWWRENRTAAPNAVREELERIFSLLETTPLIGRPANDVELPNVRRVHVTRIWHFLYYRLRSSPDRVEILSIWGERRDAGPGL